MEDEAKKAGMSSMPSTAQGAEEMVNVAPDLSTIFNAITPILNDEIPEVEHVNNTSYLLTHF